MPNPSRVPNPTILAPELFPIHRLTTSRNGLAQIGNALTPPACTLVLAPPRESRPSGQQLAGYMPHPSICMPIRHTITAGPPEIPGSGSLFCGLYLNCFGNWSFEYGLIKGAVMGGNRNRVAACGIIEFRAQAGRRRHKKQER